MNSQCGHKTALSIPKIIYIGYVFQIHWNNLFQTNALPSYSLVEVHEKDMDVSPFENCKPNRKSLKRTNERHTVNCLPWQTAFIYSCLLLSLVQFVDWFFIPHATSCGGYNVFYPSVRPSVCQSVSPVFLVSATPLKPLNRISWNFVVMKDIIRRCAYPQEMLIPIFFTELRPF